MKHPPLLSVLPLARCELSQRRVGDPLRQRPWRDDASRTRRERYVQQPSKFDTLKLFALGSHNIGIAMATPKILLKKTMEWNVISDYYACGLWTC
ncbi:uncharacterized protein G2W53_029951 [Senna tora]|uniref:Uncharacterized protein n=1 Tax=Senna tora TaxID=362788 RepID=A0A834T652_9FABA|nr:uncharacterized protein G2W53_029951 [Senna tora]